MSYLARIAACNQYDLSHYKVFTLHDEKVGWINSAFEQELSCYPDVFSLSGTSITFNSKLDTADKLTSAANEVFVDLHQKGVIDTWVGEIYPLVMKFGETPRMYVERAATMYLGVKGFGVHANGLVKKDDGIYVWIGTRTMDKPFWPGKLDQMVAGGQPAKISLLDNLVKEAAEEANIPEQMARQANYITALSYCCEGSRGLNPDTLFVYDIWIPESFIPENTDGEVTSFQLLSLKELASIVESTSDFKENCDLVNIDLLLRQGVIQPDHQDYDEIKERLYSPAVEL